ncbi:16S rRNA (cytosine(1402)-N(4))-methyltransferase RsmH [Candidatus Woesebacteria bacterium]|nr:16S rRNA (cytosine(1402)-N(4))-methyltransferase RsmH [Candidatus Woesebacteria bacterium]
MHTTVFLEEAVDALSVSKNKRYIDATYGEGGHYQQIVEHGGIVLGIDRDENQVEKGKKRNHTVLKGAFADIADIARKALWMPVAGVLFDLGLSMEQLAKSEKGFSYKKSDEILDMRLEKKGMTAAHYLAGASTDELQNMFERYSEDPISEDLAQTIVKIRKQRPIQRVGDLTNVIDVILEKQQRSDNEKVYARIFQALRIVVNDELAQLEKGLEGAIEIVERNGSIVVISFHSVEDRLVKQFANKRKGTMSMQVMNVAKKRPLRSFERSATLRIITKL